MSGKIVSNVNQFVNLDQQIVTGLRLAVASPDVVSDLAHKKPAIADRDLATQDRHPRARRRPDAFPDRIRLAPSAWVTFEATGAAILSFLPQIAVADLNAEELPSYHRNIDMDEVMLTPADNDPKGRPPRRFFVHVPVRVARGQ